MKKRLRECCESGINTETNLPMEQMAPDKTEEQTPVPGGIRLGPLQKAYERFVKIRGNPREIALGFALGVFVGISPTMGLQTAIAIFLAALFKWNKISAAVGVWISNPLTAPFLYSITYFAGARILGMDINLHQPDIGVTTFFLIIEQAPGIFWAMSVGGIVLGLPIAVAAYTFAFSGVSKYQEGIRRRLAARRQRLAQRKRKRKPKRKKRKR